MPAAASKYLHCMVALDGGDLLVTGGFGEGLRFRDLSLQSLKTLLRFEHMSRSIQISPLTVTLFTVTPRLQ